MAESSIGFMTPVESISRKFARRQDKVSAKNPGFIWMGASTTIRPTKETTGRRRNFLVFRTTPRSTPVKETEVLARVRFATIATWVNQRAHDTSKQQQDIAAFLAQKDLPGGVKSLKAYYWQLGMDEYDQQHGG